MIDLYLCLSRIDNDKNLSLFINTPVAAEDFIESLLNLIWES